MENPYVMKSDVAVGSSKVLTVPANRLWRLQLLAAKLTSTGTAGNRQVTVVIGDGTNILWTKDFGNVQAASLTRQYYAAADLPTDAAFDANGNIRMLMWQWVLPAGYTVRVYDSAAIAAGADTLEVRLLVEEIWASVSL